MRSLRIRLLGDRVLRNVAWKIADELGWPDTLDAEYIAPTRLQAGAFITLDAELVDAMKGPRSDRTDRSAVLIERTRTTASASPRPAAASRCAPTGTC